MRARVTAFVMALSLIASPVRAGDAEADAQAHLDRGVASFHAGAYADAHVEFLAAHELAPDRANPYRWLALTEVQLGRCPDALGNIAEFLRRVPADDARIAELVRLRGLCERITRAPEPAPPRRARRPLTHRWWFWTAVVGAAAALTTTIVIAGADDGPTLLPPIHCDDTGCAP